MSLDHIQRYICNQQKSLYEYIYKNNINIREFSDRFLQSNYSNNILDKPYAADQYFDIVNWLEFLEREFVLSPSPLSNNNISESAAGWMGFTYRQLHFTTGLSSKEIYEKVPFNKLILSYGGLHTVDEDMAAEIIEHDFKLNK